MKLYHSNTFDCQLIQLQRKCGRYFTLVKYEHKNFISKRKESIDGRWKVLILEKIRQVLEKDWSQQEEHMQVSSKTGPGVRWS